MENIRKPVGVDEYIKSLPVEIRPKLKELRAIIKGLAPKAEEKISYGMPYYSYHGRLVYFMAHKNHLGFYPMKSGISKFKNELESYNTSAGTVQFPYDKPLPVDLIRKIILFRINENEMIAKLKEPKKK
jgi:uncharacterized protein YdhG (YjbR/CyaY superfamily)